MSTGLKGRGAIVTGAARGIGFAIARSLAEDGASVLLVDREASLAEGAARRLAEAGLDVHPFIADVTSAADMEAMAAEAITRFGRLDILCPNAAIFDAAEIVDMPEALWDRLLGINLKGVFLAVKACLPTMIAQRSGRIVVTSSCTGNRTAIAGMAHYAASKGGINGFIRAAALEHAANGITVNGVEPGHVLTEGTIAMYDEASKQVMERYIPVGRFADPADIGRAVVFLSGDGAGYITGQTILVDGGLTLREYPPGYPIPA